MRTKEGEVVKKSKNFEDVIFGSSLLLLLLLLGQPAIGILQEQHTQGGASESVFRFVRPSVGGTGRASERRAPHGKNAVTTPNCFKCRRRRRRS